MRNQTLKNFDSGTDDFRPPYSTNSDRTLPSVQLNIVKEDFHRKNLYFPATSKTCAIEGAGVVVGEITYIVSPIKDCVFIDSIQIYEKFKRSGYGLATIWKLHDIYHLPLVPVHILSGGVAHLFWAQATIILGRAGAQVLEGIRRHDVEKEQQAWVHLMPECPIEKSIRLHEEWVASQLDTSADHPDTL